MKKVFCLFLSVLIIASISVASAYTSQSEDVKLAIGMLEKAIKHADCYSYYSISADDAGFWICVTQDGAAQEIADAKEAGIVEMTEAWKASREDVIGVCDSMYNFVIETIGFKNKILGFFILDDTNRSNVLMAAIGTESGTTLVYDTLFAE